MLITNWWGIFFSFVMPVIIAGIGLYYEGIEEEKKIIKAKRRKK